MGAAVVLDSTSWIVRFLESFKVQFLETLKISDISSEIKHAILQDISHFQIGNVKFILTDAIFAMWIAVPLFILLWIWISAKREHVPTGRQLISESIIDLFLTLCKSNGMSHKQAEKVAPFIGTVCFFLIACNLSSVFRLSPPAKNVAFPIALALFTMIYVLFTSIRIVGFKGFWNSLINPIPAMLPFKILDYLIKPLSLSMRLFGNIFGAFILMEFVYLVVPMIIPGIIGIWFDILDGILQAAIFAYLSTTYIGEILEGAEAAEEKRHERDKNHHVPQPL